MQWEKDEEWHQKKADLVVKVDFFCNLAWLKQTMVDGASVNSFCQQDGLFARVSICKMTLCKNITWFLNPCYFYLTHMCRFPGLAFQGSVTPGRFPSASVYSGGLRGTVARIALGPYSGCGVGVFER